MEHRLQDLIDVPKLQELQRAEEERKTTLSLLAATLEATADGILVRDTAGNISTFNRKFAEMWRFTPAVLATRDDAQFRSFILDQLKDPEKFIVMTEYQYVHLDDESCDILELKDGRMFERVARPQRIDGKIVGRVTSLRDVTELKKAEKEISRINRALRTLSACNRALVYATDERSLLIEVCQSIAKNGGYRFTWVGYPVDDEARSVLPVAQAGHEDGYLDAIKVSWDDSDRGKGPVGMAIRTGKPFIIRDIDTDINFAPWREEAHKRGYSSVAGLPLTIEKEILGSLTIYASETDAFNLSEVELLQELAVNLAYGIKSLRALEDRKRADEALRESEDRYRSLVDNMDLGISLIGSDNEVLKANAALSKIFNKPMSDLLKGKCFCKFENQTEVCPDCPREAVFRTGKTSSIVREVIRPDGIRMVIRIHAFALNVSGERRCIEVVNDITEKKIAEEEKLHLENQLRHSQKMEAIGTLAGGVAHDFNNILTCILGYCSLMEMKIADDDPLRAYPAKIMASANRAAVLTQGLLTYSRKQPLHPRPVDVNEVVEQVEHLLARLLNEEIELSINTVKTPLTVLADSLQIEQVLINLATNARDAMPRGGLLQIATGWLEMDINFIKAHGYGKPGSYALITVSDTGAGMDDGTKKRIFEPFYTTKEVGKGTGLGLSITYGIVKQHDGFINVDSEVGKGTTFAIYLPLTDIQGVVQPQTLQMIPATGNETVLLVEDNEALRNTLKEILENSGYRVIGAVDGEDGLRKFQEFGDEIQLLILDVIMPKKNGRQLNEEIQAQRPGTKAVFISGYTADILSARGTLQDDTILIAKPLASHTLLTKIREVLDK